MTRKIPAYWIAMILFCILGMLIGLFPGYRFSAGICFGIAAVIGCFRILIWLGKTRPKLSNVLRKLLSVGLALVILAAAVTGVIVIHASAGHPEEACNYLIVLGAGVNGTVPSLSLRERLDAAYDYLQEYPHTICVVSGGQGSGEDITEAECMYRYLTGKGIAPERIVQEDQATSTQENLVYSLELINPEATQSVGILSSEYHLFRAGLLAKECGITTLGIPARTSWVALRINNYLREVAGVWHYLILGGQYND